MQYLPMSHIELRGAFSLPPGPRFRRVMYVEGGHYPDVFAYKVNMSCNHCAEPACLPTCPTGAIWKRVADLIVCGVLAEHIHCPFVPK